MRRARPVVALRRRRHDRGDQAALPGVLGTSAAKVRRRVVHVKRETK